MENIQKLSVGSQLYRDLKDKVNRNLFRKFSMPWMKSKEMDIITEVLTNLKPSQCLEWGSGYSTLLFPSLLPELILWHSIEHNKEWFDLIVKQIDNPKISLEWVESDNKDYSNSGPYNEKKEGVYVDFKTYINYPLQFNKKFDFIFIDGRARKHCLAKAIEMITEDGVIVVHDANRVAYFADVPSTLSFFHLTDYRKPKLRGGIWVGSKQDVSKILDTKTHKKIWEKHDRIARTLFLR